MPSSHQTARTMPIRSSGQTQAIELFSAAGASVLIYPRSNLGSRRPNSDTYFDRSSARPVPVVHPASWGL